MAIDYLERIPNNVNLADNRRLQRALEDWQPKFLDWWRDMGPEGFQARDVYLRTAVSVDAQAEQVKAVEFDAVVVPGGYAPDMMRRHPAMVALVRDAAQQGKVVAAICHAGWMLVSAGILKGRQATSFFSIKDDLVAAGADWKDAEVVIDGNLITSRKPDDLPAFCRAIVGALAKA